MAWNGSGVFSLTQNFPSDRDAGIPDAYISADKLHDEFTNIKTGLENCLTIDGQTLPTQDISWNSKKITNLADPASATGALNRQFGDARYLGLAGGTMTGALVIADGLVGAVGLAFTADLDTGFYQPADNQVGVACAGVQRLLADTSGVTVTGVLTLTGDPTGDTHVGDRGYNDLRYAKLASNLSDLPTPATARTNLGLGSMATQAASAVAITGGSIGGITDLAVADGGSGASTAANARTNFGIKSMATRDVTISTAAASGGAAGDIHFRYV